MANPFENEDAVYHVLVNGERQYSLWPQFAEVPDGWTIVLADDTREACIKFIEENWTDMRPKSLIDAMDS